MSATINVVAQRTLGQHLPNIGTLLEQLSFALTDPSPGGISSRKEELQGMLEAAEQEVVRVREEISTISSSLDTLHGLITTLTDQLGKSGVALVTVSGGTYDEVLSGLRDRAGREEPFGLGQAVYGVLLLTATPDGAGALRTILGVGNALKAPWEPQV